MEMFAREVVAQGFTHYGFSPHSPIPIESSCNMLQIDVPVYLEEVNRIKKLYGDNAKFYASMEIDYLGNEWGPSHEYFQSLPLDYRMRCGAARCMDPRKVGAEPLKDRSMRASGRPRRTPDAR